MDRWNLATWPISPQPAVLFHVTHSIPCLLSVCCSNDPLFTSHPPSPCPYISSHAQRQPRPWQTSLYTVHSHPTGSTPRCVITSVARSTWTAQSSSSRSTVRTRT